MGRPTLSIGLPVRNGEAFLEEAADALLRQSFTDIELIVSDNASTDRTEEIGRRLARRDRRVRYLRQPVDLGAVPNFNLVVEEAGGRYVKWAAHDDLHDPTFAERCVAALERDPGVVVAFTRAHTIDDEGRILRTDWGEHPDLADADSVIRFRRALAPPHHPIPLPIFGVIRADVLRRTGLMVVCPDYDRALLAELALHGPFVEVSVPLFLQREHGARLGPQLASDVRNVHALLAAPAAGRVYPHWRLLARHFASIRSAPVAGRRSELARVVAAWALDHRRDLARDLSAATETLPLVGAAAAARGAARRRRGWERRVKALARDIEQVTPADARIVLVDGDATGLATVAGRATTPLVVRDGRSWGAPRDSTAAIEELDARRAEGATHLAVAWPASWLLDYHEDFAEHLRQRHRELLHSPEVVVYELAHAGDRQAGVRRHHHTDGGDAL